MQIQIAKLMTFKKLCFATYLYIIKNLCSFFDEFPKNIVKDKPDHGFEKHDCHGMMGIFSFSPIHCQNFIQIEFQIDNKTTGYHRHIFCFQSC